MNSCNEKGELTYYLCFLTGGKFVARSISLYSYYTKNVCEMGDERDARKGTAPDHTRKDIGTDLDLSS
jgi:hypothetical protein